MMARRTVKTTSVGVAFRRQPMDSELPSNVPSSEPTFISLDAFIARWCPNSTIELVKNIDYKIVKE